MNRREMHDVILAYVRDHVPQQAILTSLGDVAQSLVEVGAELGFDLPGINVRINGISSGVPGMRLAGQHREGRIGK